MIQETIKFIDLFCGVGGIRLGMETQGFQCVFSCDIDLECKKTYEANFGVRPNGDITRIDEKSIPDHDILCAGFPCQPFSISGVQQGFDDIRGTMFFEICRILKEKNPSVVLLENVKHLMYHDSGNTLKVIEGKLKELGYTVTWRVLNAIDFGIPQNRERIIIVGSKLGTFNFDKLGSNKALCLSNLLEKEGNFSYLKPIEYTLVPSPKQHKKSGLIFAGYLNKNTRLVGVNRKALHLSRVHKQPNRIYSENGTHPTLMAQETAGRNYILLNDGKVRKLTILECWRLMGFPDNFKKVSSVSKQYKQLGNSVCVPMIAEIAKEIKNQLYEGSNELE